MKVNKIKFGRVMAVIAILCFCWITFMLTESYVRDKRVREYSSESYSSECRSISYSNGKYAVKNTRTGEITIKDIDWLFAADAYTDSLVIFSKDCKRGYFNRYTGEVVIPGQYAHAWIFSEGLAAVVKENKVGFINHRGQVVIDFQYPYLKGNDRRVDFVFHDGYCSMFGDNQKCGIINQKGEWVLKPEYDYIRNPLYGKRAFLTDGRYGVLSDSLEVVIPAEYQDVRLTPDYAVVTNSDETRMQLTYAGKVLNPMLYDTIDRLDYATGKYLEDGSEIMQPTGLYCYSVGSRRGLMDGKGRLVTRPDYVGFYVVNKQLIRGTLLDMQSDVLLNEKGEVIEQPNKNN